MDNAARILLIGALLLAVVAFLLFGLSRLGVNEYTRGELQWHSKSGNTTVYAPIGLVIVVSIVGTILLNLLFRR